ncbi:MAG: NfeD family protein [Acinetobacter sp.]|jgi:membrane protein implicated in regulation of membrane protease activity|nr:MAG: NfeD family protein [Acinetobacter sp.]
MSFNLDPSNWFLFGIALAVFEIFIPSFTIFWFGLAAIIVSGLVWLLPNIPEPIQILIWLILSIIITIGWFKYIKPLSKDRTKAGLSREATIGQVGMVIRTIPEHNEVIVRFPMPILGTDEWTCRCLETINIGDKVIVTDILGNQLLVISQQSHNKNGGLNT